MKSSNLANSKVVVIGAGLAGSDCAFFLASRGVKVVLIECKTLKLNPAQKISTFAELVCTNSLKSENTNSTHGILKKDMEALGSLVLKVAREFSVPAGDALAVDREKFSAEITKILSSHPNVEIVSREASNPILLKEEFKADMCVVATGPLTTSPLEKWIKEELAPEDFYFYDAIAPVVDGDSLDYSKLYYKDRHRPAVEGEEADYLNAPMNKVQYEAFISEMQKAEKVPSKEFESYKYFESCLPIDVMAERGMETARFSCMKPIGLEIPGKVWGEDRPYAVVQLRRENLLGEAYNLVGFQTRLTYKEQVRIFRMIPGLENAAFLHLGSVHRNSFLNAKKVLNADLSTKKFPEIYFAGQITGVEGYTESASMGLYVGHQIWRKLQGLEAISWPVETAIGALVNYIMTIETPSPSNINFGLLPPPVPDTTKTRKESKKMKKELTAIAAMNKLQEFSLHTPMR